MTYPVGTKFLHPTQGICTVYASTAKAVRYTFPSTPGFSPNHATTTPSALAAVVGAGVIQSPQPHPETTMSELTPLFTITEDHLGRTIALSPNALVVAQMANASKEGWTEVADVGWGYSKEYAPGTLVHGWALQLWQTAQDAGRGHVDYLYLTSAWDADQGRSAAGFVADREAGRVVTNLPGFGYCDNPENTPCRFQG